jgi:Ca2+-binding RTX toxin-like protein
MRRNLKTLTTVLFATVVLGAAATFSGTATAAISSSYSNGTVTVSMSANGDSVTILRGAARAILVNGVQVGSATTDNTDVVAVAGSAGEQSVTIDLSGGGFVSTERDLLPPNGSSVQFQVDLGADYDRFEVHGSSSGDTIVAGTNGITLDASSPAGELDVVVTGIDTLELHGKAGGDTISTQGGVDTGGPITVWVYGHEGDDTLLGTFFVGPGAGDDTIVGNGATGLGFSTATAPLWVDMAAGTATGEGADTFSGIRSVYGGPQADHLTGDGANNTLNGGHGNDVIRGMGGNDILWGSPGDDDLDGQAGSDVYKESTVSPPSTDDDIVFDTGSGSDDVDWLDYYSGINPVSVDVAAGLANGIGLDTFVGIETVRGSQHADVLKGSAASDTLIGLDGPDQIEGRGGADDLQGGVDDDELLGGGGNDVLHGGDGADTLTGGAGRDTADYGDAVAGVTVLLGFGTALGGAGADLIAEIENVRGSIHADVLRGSAAANVFRGLGGNDRLYGVGRSDSLYGGAGNDPLSGGAGNRDRCYQGPGTGKQLSCEIS